MSIVRPTSTAPSPADSAAPFDAAVELLLMGLLAYLPLAFGGVLPFSHLVLIGVAAAMGVCTGLRYLRSDAPIFVRTWAYVPVAGFVALVALQAVPLPQDVVGAVAPNTARVWTELAGDPAASPLDTTAMSLSLYPQASAIDVRLLLACAVIFTVVVNVYRTAAQIRRLLGAVAIIGMAVAGLGVLQNAMGTADIYWLQETPRGRALGGPFVHPGHFSQFVNLAMGCAFALLLVRLAEQKPNRQLGVEDLFADLLHPERRFDLVLVVFLVLGIVGIAMSESRNGLISMAVAGAVVAAVLQRTRVLSGVGWALGGLVFAAFVVLLLIGFDPVYERISTLEAPGEEYSPRLAILTDTLAMAREFPVFGIGHGAFRLVFPMFDTSERALTAEHAENQYAEMLAETGGVGFVLGIALALIVAVTWVRTTRSRQSGLDGALFGLGFGVIAVAFHALTDFGLRVPAVSVLMTVSLALIVGMAPARARTGAAGRSWGAASGLLGAALLLIAVPPAVAAWRAERHWRTVVTIRDQLAPPDFLGTEKQYDELIDNAERAESLQPGDIEYHHWTTMHRWHRALAAHAGYPSPAAAPAVVEHTPELVAMAVETQKALLAGRAVAPTFGPLWSLAGQLGVHWLDDPLAGRWVHRGLELAPHHPATCLAAARQLLHEGDVPGAVAAFRRAIAMGSDWQFVLEALVGELGRADVAHEVAKSSPRWLVFLEQLLAKRGGYDDLVAELNAECREVLERHCTQSDAPSWMFARLAHYHVSAGDDEGAVRYYRRYLTREPTSTVRFNLARVLVRLEQREAARVELKRLLAVNPGHDQAKQLLANLSRG